MRNKILFKFVYILFATFACERSFADVLMIDFNNSMTEIAKAQQAAQARGERLIVIPSANDPVRRKLIQIKSQSAVLNQQIERIYESAKDGDSEAAIAAREETVSKLYAQINELRSQKMDAEKIFGLKKYIVDKEISTLANQGKTFSSVVISGHDGNGHFSGDYSGSMVAAEFGEIFKKYPKQFEGTRSLLLWGCYTGTPSSLEFNWKKQLPNLDLLAGFDQMAPLSATLASPQQLHDILAREKKLTAQKDLASLKAQFKGLSYANMTNVSLCVRDNYINNRTSSKMSALLEGCNIKSIDQGLMSEYRKYLNAEPGYENPPTNTGSNKIRQFYNNLQANEHCRKFFAEQGIYDLPQPDQVVRLIFFDNYKKNFQANQKVEIERINELLKKFKAPEDLKIPDLTKLNRQQVIDLVSKLQVFANQQKYMSSNYENNFGKEVLELNSLVYLSSQYLRLNNLGPFGWVEPENNQKIEMFNSNVSSNFKIIDGHIGALRREEVDKVFSSQNANPAVLERYRTMNRIQDGTATQDEINSYNQTSFGRDYFSAMNQANIAIKLKISEYFKRQSQVDPGFENSELGQKYKKYITMGYY